MKETSNLLDNTNKTHYTKSTTHQNQFKTYNGLYCVYSSTLYCCSTYFQQSIAPITDVLQKELSITSSGIGLLSASFSLTYFLMQIPFGLILQKYSHHIILLSVAIGLAVSWFLFGVVNTFAFAIIIRILSGLFGASTWIVTVTVIGEHFGNNQVALLGGFTVLFTYSYILIFITFQGYMYETYNIWREIFYITGFIGFITVIGIILTMYCQQKKIKQTQNTLTNSNISWINLFSQNSVSPSNAAKLFENETKHASLWNKLKTVISNKLNWYLLLWGFSISTISTTTLGLWLIPYLMLKFSYSRILSSFYVGISSMFLGIGSLFFGYLSAKYKKRRILLMIQVLFASTFLFLMYLDEGLLNKYIVFIILIIFGFGCSLTLSFTLVREYNAKYLCEETATGFVSSLQSSSGLIAAYVVGLLIDYHYQHRNAYDNNIYDRQYNVDDYQFAFSCVIPICLIISIITTFLMKETNGKNLK